MALSSTPFVSPSPSSHLQNTAPFSLSDNSPFPLPQTSHCTNYHCDQSLNLQQRILSSNEIREIQVPLNSESNPQLYGSFSQLFNHTTTNRCQCSTACVYSRIIQIYRTLPKQSSQHTQQAKDQNQKQHIY